VAKHTAEEVMENVMIKFKKLPLLSKLVIYSNLKHGTYRPSCNDLFGMTKSQATKIYSQFLIDLNVSGEF
jgi:hypothetical protein